jgi:hypothetical protein
MAITDSSTPTPSASSGAGLTPAQQKALDSIAASIGNSGSGGPGKVFMGYTPGKTANSRFTSEAGQARQQTQPRTPSWWSLSGATSQYFNWTQKQRDDFRAKGLLSGLLTQGAGDLEAYSLWQNLVNQAALYGAQGQEVGPLDILSGYVKSNSSGGWIKQGDFEINPVTGEKRYIGPQFKTTTQSNIDVTDPATARAIATKVFQDLLGRDPGQGEIQAYANALSQSEANNPSSTTTTTQYDPTTGEATNSSSVTTGGMTDDARALLASDQLKKNKEYGAYQAATTYQNALDQAVYGGPS